MHARRTLLVERGGQQPRATDNSSLPFPTHNTQGARAAYTHVIEQTHVLGCCYYYCGLAKGRMHGTAATPTIPLLLLLLLLLALSTADAFLLPFPSSSSPSVVSSSSRVPSGASPATVAAPRRISPVVAAASGGGWDDDEDVRFSGSTKHIDTGFLKVRMRQ